MYGGEFVVYACVCVCDSVRAYLRSYIDLNQYIIHMKLIIKFLTLYV